MTGRIPAVRGARIGSGVIAIDHNRATVTAAVTAAVITSARGTCLANHHQIGAATAAGTGPVTQIGIPGVTRAGASSGPVTSAVAANVVGRRPESRDQPATRGLKRPHVRKLPQAMARRGRRRIGASEENVAAGDAAAGAGVGAGVKRAARVRPPRLPHRQMLLNRCVEPMNPARANSPLARHLHQQPLR